MVGDLPMPRVAVGLPEALERAAREFVRRKDLLDDWACTPMERWRVPVGLTSGNSGTFDPHAFVVQVLPFAGAQFSGEGVGSPAQAPVNQTIGERWKGRRAEGLSDAERERYRSELTDPARADADDPHAALYTWFEPLGMVAACEGKNRVSFLRDVGEEWIPASITRRGYPSAERIQLFEVDVLGQTQVWATLDEQLVQAVPHYAIARELLQAYGVRGPVAWPTAWPTPAAVSQVFARQRKRSGFSGVDLVDLAERIASSEEEMPLALTDITWLRWNPVPWLALGTVTLVSVPLACFAPWDLVRWCATATVGGVSVALGVLCLPLWRGRASQASGGHADATG